jgi:hypothetical protein
MVQVLRERDHPARSRRGLTSLTAVAPPLASDAPDRDLFTDASIRFGIGPNVGLGSKHKARAAPTTVGSRAGLRPLPPRLGSEAGAPTNSHQFDFRLADYFEAVASRSKRSKVELPRSVLKSLSSGISLRSSGLRRRARVNSSRAFDAFAARLQ